MSNQQYTRRRRRWVFLTVGAAAVITLIVCGVHLVGYTTGPVDLRGQHVTYDTGAAPTDKSSAVPQTGKDRFDVPSVGLDVPLGAMNMVGGAIEPPGFTSTYWVRNLGVAPDQPTKGTVFVVMHSLRNGAAGPGNYLIDVDKASAKVGLGQKITVAGVTYTVSSTLAIDKPAIADANAVWANTPNRIRIRRTAPTAPGTSRRAATSHRFGDC